MAKRNLDTAAAVDKEAKHLRGYLDESKKLLEAIPVVHWRLRVHKWEWLVEATDLNLAIVQRGIERMQRAPATHLEHQRGKVLTLTRETMNLMSEGLGLLSGGEVDSEIDAMKLFLDGKCARERTASYGHIQMLDAKLVYYARAKDAKSAQDRDELLTEKMRVTKEFGLPGDAGLSVRDAVVLTTDFLERARSVKEIILTYVDSSVDAKDLFPIQTKAQLKKVCEGLKRRNYAQLWQSASCSARLEEKLDTFQCDNLECTHHLCSECFASEIFKSADEQYHDLERLQRVARLSCFCCRAGTMPPDICRAMPTGGLEAFLSAVEVLAQAEKANDAAHEQAREVQRFRALPSCADKIFKLEQDIIAELITIKCPTCLAPFGAFDACCSLTCTSCGSVFCALCLGGPFANDDIAHAHVAECEERPDGMPDLFLDLDTWKGHMERRQHKQIRQYLDATDLADDVKHRLLYFFSVP